MKILKKILLNALKAYKRRFRKVLSIEFSMHVMLNALCVLNQKWTEKKSSCLWTTLSRLIDDCVGMI